MSGKLKVLVLAFYSFQGFNDIRFDFKLMIIIKILLGIEKL
jgi:hypothetical protein